MRATHKGVMRKRVESKSDLLAQIERLEAHFESREPEVLAFLPEAGRFARVRREARALLKRYPDPMARPPLFGVFVGVKDLFRVRDFPTRAGSRLPPELFGGPEADSVSALTAAGVIVLGKTVSAEFGYFAPGPTRNPRHAEHTPGGSSSGSAAAVAAELCSLALGTQTIGSIVRPASFCGVVGYKPSYDRISCAGVIPLSPSLDHVGVFSPDVAGALQAARLLCRDWQPAMVNHAPVLGVPEGPYLAHADEAGLAHFRKVCTLLTARGFSVRAVPAMPDFEDIRLRHELIVAAEAAQVHAAWFSEYEALYHTCTAELIRRGHAVAAEALARARVGRGELRGELTALMDANGLDLWISPAAPGAAPKSLDTTGNPVMNLPWTHSGLPTLSLPAGADAEGLPLGLQVAGRWQCDELLLAWGHSLALALRA